MDIGASTGGFTDCMLQNGARKVYAIDVGYGQLAWTLRNDPRVVNIERTNARYLNSDTIPETVDIAVTDASFISVKLLLPAIIPLLAESGDIVCLIKPQFEAGRDQVGKKGVVRDPNVHISVIEDICAFAKMQGLRVEGLDYSPIKGPEGNIEYLCYMKKAGSSGADKVFDIPALVGLSHKKL
jgi:23S rRNA (cytidine1920-2'-O)/16S rRNA (cytidine1409-2'-O)-methyltransferase